MIEMSQEYRIIPEPFQGSEEWLALRRTKITATDARVIMQVDPWKTKKQLYEEKLGIGKPKKQTYYMKRGLDLEDGIRDHLEKKYGLQFQKVTIVRGIFLASLDAMSNDGSVIAEIKCPGIKDHELACRGIIPDKYYPQLQFTLHVSGLDFMYYESSADGQASEMIIVKRNQIYIDDMIEKCKDFYQMILNDIEPECEDRDFIERNDTAWESYAIEYQELDRKIQELEEEKKRVRKYLIYLSESKNSKGCGISLKKVSRKGSLDYSKLLLNLNDIDVEQYRKQPTAEWRIMIQ